MIFSLRNDQKKGNVFIWAKSFSKKQFEHANLLLDIDRLKYTIVIHASISIMFPVLVQIICMEFPKYLSLPHSPAFCLCLTAVENDKTSTEKKFPSCFRICK